MGDGLDTPKTITPISRVRVHDKITRFKGAAMKEVVVGLCEAMGYGAVMQVASEVWQAKDPKGGFVVGPCAAFTEPCGCESPKDCEWCCGCGWLTKHVAIIKNRRWEQL